MSDVSERLENLEIENAEMSTGEASPLSNAAVHSPVMGVMRTPFREWPVA